MLCKKLGYTKSELTGHKSDILFTLPTRIFQQTHLFPLLKMQGYAEEIFITLRKNGGDYLPVLINVERKTFPEGMASVYVGIVVHNRQKFEEELIAARNTAEKALNENTALIQAKEELQLHAEVLDQKIGIVNKQNEELRQFNKVVTHNIQEPLRKLSVFSGLLVEEKNTQKQQALIEKVKRAMAQMQNVVSGLQQYVWLDEAPLNPLPLQLEQFLPALKDRLAADYPEVTLDLDTEKLKPFEGDPAQIEILFYQLLNNAVRFRKEAGKAFVRITTSTLRQNRFKNIEGRYKYIDYLRIQVQDRGTGFDTQYKERVFELFNRMHKESGRGVGLALCKKVVDNHQGTITIDSEAGEGTLVTILLPLRHSGSLQPPAGGEEKN